MLLDLKLPSFSTIIHNDCVTFNRQLLSVDNVIVSAVSQ